MKTIVAQQSRMSFWNPSPVISRSRQVIPGSGNLSDCNVARKPTSTSKCVSTFEKLVLIIRRLRNEPNNPFQLNRYLHTHELRVRSTNLTLARLSWNAMIRYCRITGKFQLISFHEVHKRYRRDIYRHYILYNKQINII